VTDASAVRTRVHEQSGHFPAEEGDESGDPAGVIPRPCLRCREVMSGDVVSFAGEEVPTQERVGDG
jgi:hypothetical protein